MGCEDVMNLRNLSQEELIKMINEKDKKIEALTEQLNWYSQQIKLQQKKLLLRSLKLRKFLPKSRRHNYLKIQGEAI